MAYILPIHLSAPIEKQYFHDHQIIYLSICRNVNLSSLVAHYIFYHILGLLPIQVSITKTLSVTYLLYQSLTLR